MDGLTISHHDHEYLKFSFVGVELCRVSLSLSLASLNFGLAILEFAILGGLEARRA